jgi:uncharacterized SAM-binding protein YcdF (DUF218 family)
MPVPSPFRPASPRSAKVRAFPPAWSWFAAGLPVLLFAFGGFAWWRADSPGSRDPLPAHARYGFVLDGQSPDGFRVREGYELLHGGIIDTLIVSGVEIGGGVHFSTVWVRMLPLVGSEKERVLEWRSACSSTLCEARMMDAYFEERNVDSSVVVTSGFHVWRAASIFAKASQGRRRWFFQGAPDTRWDSGWMDREGLKSRFFEWTKRIVWILFEQWKPLPRTSPVQPHSIARGEELGRMPASAWKTGP